MDIINEIKNFEEGEHFGGKSLKAQQMKKMMMREGGREGWC